MVVRHASVLLAAIVVIARLVSSGGPASARTTTEETVRGELACHNAPSRKVRWLSGPHGRVAAGDPQLGAWLEALPIVIEEPPRALAPPSVVPPAVAVETLPPPATQARAPPR